MKTLEKNKGIVIAVIVFALVIFAYNTFKADIFPEPQTRENIGADLVELYAGLQSVTLNKEVFSSPLYASLSDFSVDLGVAEVGRLNPFNTIGRD